jgi:hypothetical protein
MNLYGNTEEKWHEDHGCAGFWQFAVSSGFDGQAETLYRHCRICGRVQRREWNTTGRLKPFVETWADVPEEAAK